MKKYFITDSGKEFKANLHTHTTSSDCTLTPEQIKEVYKQKGYSVVAFTDHEKLYDRQNLTDDEFLALNGYELEMMKDGDKPYALTPSVHLLMLAKTPDVKKHVVFDSNYCKWNGLSEEDINAIDHDGDQIRELNEEWLQRAVTEGNNAGYLVTLCHPEWSLITSEDYRHIEGLWGVEVFNTASYAGGFYENTLHYTDLLRQGEFVHALATDDTHSLSHVGGGYVVIKSEKLDYPSIMKSLEEGNFYASTGAEIKSCYIEDGYVYVKCSPARFVLLYHGKRKGGVVQFKDGKVIECPRGGTEVLAHTDEGITEVKFKIESDYKQFLRVEITGANEDENAWSNPIWLDL